MKYIPAHMIDLTTKDGFDEACERIEKIRQRRWLRAMDACRAAGCETPLQLHNAIACRRAGRPWQGVDYTLAPKALRMLNEQFVGQAYLDRLWTRLCRVQYGYKGR